MKARAPSSDLVARRLADAGFELAPEQARALARFLELLARWNRVHNLTAIRDPQAAVERHLLESLALAPLLRGERVADIGTGAGLPGMPLAIAEPSRHFTLIESRAKRVAFLRHVAGDLGLANVTVAHGRAEDLRPEQPFDTVLARAVAPPAELLALSAPLVAPKGVAVLSTTEPLCAELARLAPAHGLEAVRRTDVPHARGTVLILERAGD